MQRARQCRRRSRHRQIGISLGATYDPHGSGAAILLVVRMQDEQNIQSARDHRADNILGLSHAPKHVHEVFRIAKIIVRIDMSLAMAVRVRRQRRHLGDQANDLALPDFTVAHVTRFRINRGERCQRADEHSHGMGIVTEAIDEMLGGLMQHGVEGDFVHPFRFAFGIG